MAIQFLQCHATGVNAFEYVEPLANDIVSKMHGIGFEVVTPVTIVGVNANFTMGWNGYEVAYSIVPGSYYINVSLNYNGTNIASIGNYSVSNSLYEGTFTIEYAKHGDDFMIGFCPYNWSGYTFSVGFWKLADNYFDVSVLPAYLTTEATLLNGTTPDGAWRNMFNVSTDLPNKGLFRQFIRTKSNGYLDMTNEAKTSMYNINTGFTFTLHSPVEVNGIPFIPINNWTLFQYD